MNFINSIIYALGILVILAGIGLGLKALYAIVRSFITRRRAKRQLKKAGLPELEKRIELLEKRIPSSRKLNPKVRTEVRNYLKELQK